MVYGQMGELFARHRRQFANDLASVKTFLPRIGHFQKSRDHFFAEVAPLEAIGQTAARFQEKYLKKIEVSSKEAREVGLGSEKP